MLDTYVLYFHFWIIPYRNEVSKITETRDFFGQVQPPPLFRQKSSFHLGTKETTDKQFKKQRFSMLLFKQGGQS